VVPERSFGTTNTLTTFGTHVETAATAFSTLLYITASEPAHADVAVLRVLQHISLLICDFFFFLRIERKVNAPFLGKCLKISDNFSITEALGPV
jgi:hypothetical protein